jgi:hypothetical protein
MSIRDRVGKFRIARVVVDDQPEMVMAIMGRCVVVDCKLHFISNSLEYWALSPDFDEVPVGAMEPEYSVLVELVDDLPVVSFKRISA